MSELTVLVFRLALLGMLWAFVFSVVGVLRGDLYGTKVVTRGGQRTTHRTVMPDEPGSNHRRALRKGPQVLAVVEGRLRGTTLPLTPQGIVVGRNPECTLVLGDDSVSGRHARIYALDDQWFCDDLGSTNGTWVDGARITVEAPLATGSRIQVGQTTLELHR